MNLFVAFNCVSANFMRIKAFFWLVYASVMSLIGCLYTEIEVELGAWLGYDPQFNSVPLFMSPSHLH